MSRLARGPALGFVLFGVLAALWVLGAAPSSGSDEPSHAIRSGAVVRGELAGEALGPSIRVFDLPAHIGAPDPACYAFQPDVPATCATAFGPPGGDARLVSTSASYPVWGHVLPGLGTFFGADASGPASRLFDAAIPVAFVVMSLLAAARRSRLAAAATLFAVTVPVWFNFAIVNPSGLVIGGAIALWTGLLSQHRANMSKLERILVVGGWVAMVLPRRDGMLYAALIVSVALLFTGSGLRDRWRQLGIVGQAIIASTTAIMLVWALGSDLRSTQLLVVTPLIPLVVAAGRDIWSRTPRTREQLIGWSAATAVAVAAASLVLASMRGDGFDGNVLQLVIGRTGADLGEAIGLIGWLDTPIPASMVMLFLAGLGVLFASSLLAGDHRRCWWSVAILAGAIWISWVLTMLQNDPLGTYWQGRYYLPLLVGIPILLGAVDLPWAARRRVSRLLSAVMLIVLTVGFAAAMRRWGVGIDGSMLPWNWHTYDAPVPPLLLLWLHLVTAVLTFRWVDGLVDDSAEARAAGLRVPSALLVESDEMSGSVHLEHPGVNIVGYHHASSGLGTVARAMVAALDREGLPHVAVDIALTKSPAERSAMPEPAVLFQHSVIVATAAELQPVLEWLDGVRAAPGRVIGYWFWELEAVPQQHIAAASLVHEVWTPTEFVTDAYEHAGLGRPVTHVPVPIGPPNVDARAARLARRLLVPGEHRGRQFVFLVCLDLMSVVDRKNPFDAIEAFTLAFADDGHHEVRLVVKTVNGDKRRADLERITAMTDNDDRISVVDEHVSSDELDAMIAAADCYVSLHRSEGLGLHLVSAMWSGTPVLATNYSGNVDLMDDSTAALVDAGMVPVGNVGVEYDASARWAQPDVEEAAAWMRRLVVDPTAGSDLASAALVRMEDQFQSTEFGARLRRMVLTYRFEAAQR